MNTRSLTIGCYQTMIKTGVDCKTTAKLKWCMQSKKKTIRLWVGILYWIVSRKCTIYRDNRMSTGVIHITQHFTVTATIYITQTLYCNSYHTHNTTLYCNSYHTHTTTLYCNSYHIHNTPLYCNSYHTHNTNTLLQQLPYTQHNTLLQQLTYTQHNHFTVTATIYITQHFTATATIYTTQPLYCYPRQTISMWYCEQVPWQNNIDFEWLYAEQINITEHENFTSPIALTSDCGCTMSGHSNVVVLVFTITNDEQDK